MKWTTLNFGKYAGFSLPQVIMRDPDYFFWAFDEGVFQGRGRLADEAEDVASKAKAIKIPKPDPENWEVECRYGDDGRFMELGFVPAGEPSYCGYRNVSRSAYIDLSVIRHSRTYDKRGCKYLLRDFCHLYFGDDIRLTKRRCEKFFSRRRNFMRSAKAVRRGEK
jgi:hypothetical protein